MAIFNSYVKLPEGRYRGEMDCQLPAFTYMVHHGSADHKHPKRCDSLWFQIPNHTHSLMKVRHSCLLKKVTVEELPFQCSNMAVSWNRGTPKSSILIGFSIKPLYVRICSDHPEITQHPILGGTLGSRSHPLPRPAGKVISVKSGRGTPLFLEEAEGGRWKGWTNHGCRHTQMDPGGPCIRSIAATLWCRCAWWILPVCFVQKHTQQPLLSLPWGSRAPKQDSHLEIHFKAYQFLWRVSECELQALCCQDKRMEKLMKTAVPWELQAKLVGGVGLNTFG